jgi:hypothetical protein
MGNALASKYNDLDTPRCEQCPHRVTGIMEINGSTVAFMDILAYKVRLRGARWQRGQK